MVSPQQAIEEGNGTEPIHTPKVLALGKRVYTEHSTLIYRTIAMRLGSRGLGGLAPITISAFAHALL